LSISIVIPAFGKQEDILRCYLSVLNYPKPEEYEIIVVDDSNNFDVMNLLGRNLNKHTRVLRNQTNLGAQKSRSLGLSLCTKSHVMFVDCDDYLDYHQVYPTNAGYIVDACELLRNDDIAAFVYGPTVMFGEAEGFTSSAYPLSLIDVLTKHHVPIFMIYRRTDAPIEKMYPPQIKKWQDWHAAITLLNCRYEKKLPSHPVYIDVVCYHYQVTNSDIRVSQTNVSERDMCLLTIESNKSIFKDVFGNLRADELCKIVIGGKPSLIDCILRISNHSLSRAQAMVRERQISVSQKLSRRIAP
jgi:glycosyltransferase involved in cell wall biosynthesis